jgi:PadR family transcriptional regulator, regulatory protein PadR
MIVMAALAAAPAHGYAIIQEIRGRSAGEFDLTEGTIYPVLHRLELAGLLESRWTVADSGRKRRTYELTRQGKKALRDRQVIWRRFIDAVGSLLQGVEHAPG